jgi:hypothetical protein
MPFQQCEHPIKRMLVLIRAGLVAPDLLKAKDVAVEEHIQASHVQPAVQQYLALHCTAEVPQHSPYTASKDLPDDLISVLIRLLLLLLLLLLELLLLR